MSKPNAPVEKPEVLKTVETLVSGKLSEEETTKLLETVNNLYTQREELHKNFTATTNKFTEAVETRQKTKEKFNKIREALGLPDDYKDEDIQTLSNKLKIAEQVKSPEDWEKRLRDEISTNVEKVRRPLENEVNVYKSQVTEYQQKLQELQFEKELFSSGIMSEIDGDGASDYLSFVLKQSVWGLEDGRVVFKNGDGTTKYTETGSPMGIKDFYKDLKTKGKFDAILKSRLQGSGLNPSGGTGTKNLQGLDLYAAGAKRMKENASR
jgi:hypothetical protein